MKGYTLTKSTHGKIPEEGLVPLGEKDSIGKSFCLAVAETYWGLIPGKAKNGRCWCTYKGLEYSTKEFSYVQATFNHVKKVTHEHDEDECPPEGAIKVGCEKEAGDMYAAIALGPKGRQTLGKARGHTCMYGQGGQERETDKFCWLIYNSDPNNNLELAGEEVIEPEVPEVEEPVVMEEEIVNEAAPIVNTQMEDKDIDEGMGDEDEDTGRTSYTITESVREVDGDGDGYSDEDSSVVRTSVTTTKTVRVVGDDGELENGDLSGEDSSVTRTSVTTTKTTVTRMVEGDDMDQDMLDDVNDQIIKTSVTTTHSSRRIVTEGGDDSMDVEGNMVAETTQDNEGNTII